MTSVGDDLPSRKTSIMHLPPNPKASARRCLREYREIDLKGVDSNLGYGSLSLQIVASEYMDCKHTPAL